MSEKSETGSNVFRKEAVQEAREPYRLTLHPGLEPVANIITERRRLEIKAKISREASKKIETSRLQAREEIAQARADSDEIIEKAQEEAKAIVEKARQQEKAISDEARKQGLAHAREIARQEALEKVQQSLQVLENAAHEVKELRKQFLRSSIDGMAEIVVTIASRVLRGAVDVDRELVLRTLREACAAITAADRIVVRIHPDDVDVVEGRKTEIYRLVKGLTEIDVKPDPGVDRGGVLIETAFGRIDARLETQLAELLRSVRVTCRDTSSSESAENVAAQAPAPMPDAPPSAECPEQP